MVQETSTTDPAPTPPLVQPQAVDPPPTPPLAPLAPGPGVRLVLEQRGWEVAAVPDRVVVLDDDFLHVRGFDPTTGAQLWRTRAQERASGRHTFHVVGDRVLLHAGPDLIVLRGSDGAVVGRASAGGSNGNDDGCHLQIVRGFTGAWRAHVPLSAGETACATSCACRLRLFRCDTGAPIGEPFHGSVTHLYHSLSEPHDNVCWTPPRLLGRVKGRTLLALEHEGRDYQATAVDDAGATLWARPGLAGAVQRFREVDGDPASDTCWSAAAEDVVVWTCSKGQLKWRHEYPEEQGYVRASAHLVAPGRLLVVRRSDRRSRAELRALESGKPLWERTLAADRVLLAPGDDPQAVSWQAPAVVTWIDPATGATLRELDVQADQSLVRDPRGGYLRLGGPDHAEFDREGRLIKNVPKDIQQLAWIGERWLVTLRDQQFSVMRRPDLDLALAASGQFAVDESTAALGADALLLYEHRGAEPLRIALLRAEP